LQKKISNKTDKAQISQTALENSEYIRFMSEALRLAKLAAARDEVPVGAVIVKDGAVIASAYNQKEKKNCATRHAEMIAIEKAAKTTGNWWLEDCALYVTLEPCAMCAGAMILSRIDKLFFGAYDEKTGAAGSVVNLFSEKTNHKVAVEGGIMREECAKLLSDYFKTKRKKSD
jgi:tRNA(adenine34) deaminase